MHKTIRNVSQAPKIITFKKIYVLQVHGRSWQVRVTLSVTGRKDDIYTTASAALMSLPKPKEELVRKGSGQDQTAVEESGTGQDQLMPAFTEMVNYIHGRVSLAYKNIIKYDIFYGAVQ